MLTAREFEAQAGVLARRRGWARDGVVLAAACAVLAALTTLLTGTLELPLAVGAAFGVIVAGVNFVCYREVVARLALDPSAYVIPEVNRYGRHFATAAERERLANWLRDILRESNMAECWCLADRVRRHAQQLESLATELARPNVSIRPVSAVACRRLLTCGAESPLYNPAIPSNELTAAIVRIRHGIGYDGADAAPLGEALAESGAGRRDRQSAAF